MGRQLAIATPLADPIPPPSTPRAHMACPPRILCSSLFLGSGLDPLTTNGVCPAALELPVAPAVPAGALLVPNPGIPCGLARSVMAVQPTLAGATLAGTDFVPGYPVLHATANAEPVRRLEMPA